MSDDPLAGLTPEERQAAIAIARAECWRAGDLTYKLHPGQLAIHEDIEKATTSRWVMEIARRWGKTFLLVVLAAETCLRKPKQRVVYGAPTLKHLEEFIIPALEAVAEDAPPDCRPVYAPSSGHWTFPNGSYVHLFGADDKRKADRGRGAEAALAIFDEAGFTPVLRYVLGSVFRAQLLRTSGRTILASTPAEEPDHDFTAIAARAEARGNYTRQTIHQNPLLALEQIRAFIEEEAAENGYTVEEYERTPEFRREYLAERVTDKTLAVMGDDWELGRPKYLVDSWPRPKFFDGYVVLDMGGADPRGLLFGYWDFVNQCLVIEDEWLGREQENTSLVARAVRTKEAELWGTDRWQGTLRGFQAEDAEWEEFHGKSLDLVLQFLSPEQRAKVLKAEAAPLQPYLRVCDTNLQQAIDLSVEHGISFVPTKKIELNLAVASFRNAMRCGQVRILSRCRNLDRHLRSTLWANPKAKDFARKNGEHGDLLWCAVYLWRNVRQQRNPVPHNLGVTDPVQWQINERKKHAGLRAIAGLKR